jgi:hypothetical protein
MGQIDRATFARACVHIGRQSGVDAHYLLAVAWHYPEVPECPPNVRDRG